MVKWARDIFAKGYKFKPYGAIKMGKNISKGLKYIEYGVQALDWAMKYWNAKKLERGKKILKIILMIVLRKYILFSIKMKNITRILLPHL